MGVTGASQRTCDAYAMEGFSMLPKSRTIHNRVKKQ